MTIHFKTPFSDNFLLLMNRKYGKIAGEAQFFYYPWLKRTYKFEMYVILVLNSVENVPTSFAGYMLLSSPKNKTKTRSKISITIFGQRKLNWRLREVMVGGNVSKYQGMDI